LLLFRKNGFARFWHNFTAIISRASHGFFFTCFVFFPLTLCQGCQIFVDTIYLKTPKRKEKKVPKKKRNNPKRKKWQHNDHNDK
jgi:hypothetical protein